MLTREDNELLTRVGPGTPMGQFFRQYWLPVLLSSELPDSDGPPKRARVLGENLIAFRDTSGQVGLLADNCSHRGASLFFGRNEEDGLRCVYHGWKYDVAGRCIDMPNEPPETNFKDRIRHQAYPCRDQNGLIWAYLGPRQVPPPLPDLEFTAVPAGHYQVQKTLRDCNWLQAMEGDIDNAHVPFLHSNLDASQETTLSAQIMYGKKLIRLDVVETEYGVMYGARRDADDLEYNWRIIQYMFPSWTMITTGEQHTVPSHLWTPIDDVSTIMWDARWNPTEPLVNRRRQSEGDQYLRNSGGWTGQWQQVANQTNDYLVDRQVQKTETFSGVASVQLQDKMATEGMGKIYDRTSEHLGTTDAMIVKVRNRLLAAAKALRDSGTTPPGVDQPEIYRIRSAIVNLPKEVDWQEATRETLKAYTGLPAATLG
jgi:phenylpropionate dioxygenase-like ring-hydroxylating dioxygenase large terminal subunit